MRHPLKSGIILQPSPRPPFSSTGTISTRTKLAEKVYSWESFKKMNGTPFTMKKEKRGTPSPAVKLPADLLPILPDHDKIHSLHCGRNIRHPSKINTPNLSNIYPPKPGSFIKDVKSENVLKGGRNQPILWLYTTNCNKSTLSVKK